MKISLNELRLRAYHGYYEEEQLLGGEYVTNVSVETEDVSATKSDILADTIDYQKLYVIIAEEMAKPSKLLEHVAARIRERILSFEGVKAFEINIIKENPPLGVRCKSSAVQVSYSKG